MVPSPDRRTLLGAATGLAATVLAGCVETPRNGTPEGGNTVPGTDALFDPDGLMASSHDGFLTVDGAAYRRGSAALPTAFTDGLSSVAERHGLRIADVDRFSVFGGFDRANPDSYRDDRFLLSAVATGSVDVDAAASAVSGGHGVSEAGTHRGATVYAATSGYDESNSRAYAVSDEALVGAVVDNGRAVRDARRRMTPRPRADGDSGSGSEAAGGERGETRTPPVTPTRTAEAPEVVSTAAGPGDGATATVLVERHLDALADGDAGYPGVGALLADPAAPIVGGARVDGGRLAEMLDTGSEGDIEAAADAVLPGLTAVGLTGSVSADADPPASLTIELRYGSGADASADAVESFVAALRALDDSIGTALEHVDVGADATGDTVTVEVDADPKAAFEALSGESDRDGSQGARAPQVVFSFDRREDGRVTITHDGGDTVDELLVVYKGGRGSGEERWTESDGDVAAGDSYTTDGELAGGGVLVVVWEAPDAGASSALAHYEVPES